MSAFDPKRTLRFEFAVMHNSPGGNFCIARLVRADILPHQSSILVLQDVAVIHERVLARCGLIESDEKLRFIFDEHGVLPPGEMSRRRRILDRQDAKQCAVDMKRMSHSDRGNFPDLSRSKLYFHVNTCGVKSSAIYSYQ